MRAKTLDYVNGSVLQSGNRAGKMSQEGQDLMQSAEAIINSILEARLGEYMTVEEEIQAQEETQEQAQQENEVDEPKWGLRVSQLTADDLDRDRGRDYYYEDAEERRLRLQSQIAVLQEVKALLHTQHAENMASFLDIKERGERSSKQSFWLNIATS